jgi:hypothetical protein
MKKWVLLFLLCAQVAYGAETVLDKDELVTPAAGDILYIIDDPAGTPLDKKITVDNLLSIHTGDASDAHDASAISVNSATLVGTGTDAQAVFEELDNGIADHLADTSAAHAGSAISVDSTNLIGTAANVQTVLEGGAHAIPVTVATLPAFGNAGALRWVSDGDGFSCTVGGESTLVLCYDTGTAWAPMVMAAAAATPDLDQVFDSGKSIDGANSLANAARIGDGTNQWCIYRDASLGLLIVPCTAANVRQYIQTNMTGGWYDEEGAVDILSIDPDAASTLAMYTFGTAYKPKKSIYLGAESLYGDGTQCPAAPSTVTINSGAPRSTFICTDNDGSSLYGEVAMPDAWDGGTVTFAHHYVQTAADTAVLNGDIAASCRLAAATINNTWGTEIAIDDAAVTGSSALDITTSAAVTPNGTCTAGSSRMLQFRYQLDATGTTTAVATLHHLGFKIEYSVTSLSD